MPKYFSHSLPYRRLQKFANGIWDEERKTFYPWKLSQSAVPAKRGVHYYLALVSYWGVNVGDAAAGYVTVTISVGGSSLVIVSGRMPATVAASNVNAAMHGNCETNILCDSNTAITPSGAGTIYAYSLKYAEIPADPAGGPVVIS